MLSKMIDIATQAHAGQKDRAGADYILHPLSVMDRLKAKHIDDEEILCIAVGHDLFEDTSVTPEALREAGFSERVIEGISKLTKRPGLTRKAYKSAVFSSSDSREVKMADLEDNMDLSRLPEVTDRDLRRNQNYDNFHDEILIHHLLKAPGPSAGP